MQPKLPARVGVAIVLASVALNIVFISCAAESTAPMSAAADSSSEILAQLAIVTARLDTIETKLDLQSIASNSRVDTVIANLAKVTGGSSGGAQTFTTLQASQLDSLMNLASYIADNQAGDQYNICGHLAASLGLEAGVDNNLDGKARASVGAWAGTGAFAGAEIKSTADVGGKGAFEVGGDFEACHPLFGEAPPSRSITTIHKQTQPVNSGLAPALTALASSLNWTSDRATTAITALTTALTAPPTLTSLVAVIPIPQGLQSTLSDPSAYLQNQIPSQVTNAISTLCNGSWGSPALANGLTYACGQITNPTVSIGGFFGLVSTFPAVQTAVAQATTTLTGVCSAVNSFGKYTLTISNPIYPHVPATLYSARLFPDYASPPGC